MNLTPLPRIPEASDRYGKAIAELQQAEEALRAVRTSLDQWYAEYSTSIHTNRGWMKDQHTRALSTLVAHAKEYTGRAIARLEEANRSMWGPFHG